MVWFSLGCSCCGTKRQPRESVQFYWGKRKSERGGMNLQGISRAKRKR